VINEAYIFCGLLKYCLRICFEVPAFKESSEIQVAELFDTGETFQPNMSYLYMIYIKDVLNTNSVTRSDQCFIVWRDVENLLDNSSENTCII